MAVVKHIWVLTSLSGQDLVFKAVSPPAYLKINWDCLDSHVSKTKTHLPLSLFFTSVETRICCILAWFTYSSGVSKCSPSPPFFPLEREKRAWMGVRYLLMQIFLGMCWVIKQNKHSKNLSENAYVFLQTCETRSCTNLLCLPCDIIDMMLGVRDMIVKCQLKVS